MQISGGFNGRKLEYRLQLRKSNVNEVIGNNINVRICSLSLSLSLSLSVSLSLSLLLKHEKFDNIAFKNQLSLSQKYSCFFGLIGTPSLAIYLRNPGGFIIIRR